MSLKLYFVAAEPSGDALGADVIDAIRQLRQDVEFVGVGGAGMARRGVTSLFDISDLSILGLFEGLKAYKLVKQRVDETAKDILKHQPDAVVLIDSWGFMWRLGRRMAELGATAPRIKLVGPQVWATRPGRAKTLSENVDHLLCIHAFEEPFYAPFGLPTTVIGNPALSRAKSGDAKAFRITRDVPDDVILIGLLPGSRRSEIQRVLPVLEKAAERLCEGQPDRRILCVAADAVRAAVEERAQDWRFPYIMVNEDAEKHDAFAAMDVALACSGTVTTELAMQGAPLVIGYKVGWATWAIARAFLMKSKFISLINVAANRQVAPEFVQTRFTGRAVSAAAERLLSDPGVRRAQIHAQFDALDKMGRNMPPAAKIAAGEILKIASR